MKTITFFDKHQEVIMLIILMVSFGIGIFLIIEIIKFIEYLITLL